MAEPLNWHFEITDAGKVDLANLDKRVQRRVLEKLKWFTEHFSSVAPLPLSGQWRGFFKLRVGDWRVIYEAKYDVKCITIHAIGNRNKVYKRRPPYGSPIRK